MASGAKTLDDIAKLCGVSASTISRVLNNDPKISRETRRRVLETVRAQDYQPVRRKRPVENRELRILLVTPQPHPKAPHLMEEAVSLFDGLAEAFVDSRRRLEVVNLKELSDLAAERLREGDGIISVFSLLPDDVHDSLRDAGVPVVHLNRPVTPYVASHDYKGMRKLHTHLIARGYRRPAYIGWETHPLNTERRAAYLGALAAAEEGVDPVVLSFDDPDHVTPDVPRSLLEKGVDSVMAFNDVLALRFLGAAADAGIDIPGQIAVTGYDDIPAATLSIPRLTTVRLPIFTLARLAGIWLKNAIRDRETPPMALEVVGDLVVGGTT